MDIQDLLAPATHPADNKRQRGPDGAHVQVCTLVESQAFPNNNNDDLVFESPELAKTHSSWAAFRAYLDDYCSANGLRIGVEFTVSVTSRNRELRMSKRPKSVTLLPDGLECFRRMYVCRLGRKTRARDARGSRTECPFRFTVTSVRRQGQWRVEITRGVFTHDHTQKTNFDFARAGKRQKQRSTAFDQTPTDAMNKLPPNVATAGDLVTSAGTDLLRSLHFAATVMNPTWLIAEDEVQVNDMPADSFDKVYRGLWKGSQVAVLKPRTEKDGDDAVFLRDVEIWYNLRHPHILQLFGACQKFFVCEDVDSESLDQYLPSHRHEVWGKLYEVALGLQYLHSHCVVYGPFQCRDILMGKDGRVKLSGLGMGTLEAISSLCGEKCWTARPGTVGWTAPELLCGERATFASDIYSLGMIILEAATGKCPWLSCGQVIPDGAIKFQVLKKKAFPTRPASCPENIYELVQQMCRFDASERGGLKEVIDGMSELSAKAKVYKPMCSPDELHDFDELYGDWPGQRIVMRLLESPHDKDPAPFY